MKILLLFAFCVPNYSDIMKVHMNKLFLKPKGINKNWIVHAYFYFHVIGLKIDMNRKLRENGIFFKKSVVAFNIDKWTLFLKL